MSTPARLLGDLLMRLHPFDQLSLSAALCEALSHSGDVSRAEAFQILIQLADDVMEGAEYLEETGRDYGDMYEHLIPIRNILAFTGFGDTIHKLKDEGFMNPGHLVRISLLHQMMDGHVVRTEKLKNSKVILEQVDDLLETIGGAGFEEVVLKVLVVRLSEIRLIIQNYGLFGFDKLQKELEAIMGSLVLSQAGKNSSEKEAKKKWFNKVGGFISTVSKSAKETENFTGSVLKIAENSEKIISLLPGSS